MGDPNRELTEEELIERRRRNKEIWGDFRPEAVQSQSSAFRSRFREVCSSQPEVPLALGALASVLGYGAYSYANRPAHVSPLSHLTRLRVAAQGTFVGCLLFGVMGSNFYRWGNTWYYGDQGKDAVVEQKAVRRKKAD